jgi:DeoR family transcriptional regulator, suf operon transcriptional repressor
MSIQAPHSDADLLDLLRIAGPLRVIEMAHAMEVTPTAVRQRLVRLLAKGLIQREPVRAGRGRPRHNYWLTDRGMEQTGSNFTDLAVALWHEVRAIEDQALRRDMLRRIGRAMAAGYADQIHGRTPAERMESLRELLARRRIPVSFDEQGGRPTLTAHACPYPNLADEDPSVCTMERLLFSELLGQEMELTRCRLEGDADCRFQARAT